MRCLLITPLLLMSIISNRIFAQFSKDDFFPLSIGNQKYIPGEFILGQNYPNPFNPITSIKYSTPPSSSPLIKGRKEVRFVSSQIDDLPNREVKTLVSGFQSNGIHTIEWDGKNSEGHQVAGGAYFCQLKTENSFVNTKKMILMK